MDNALKSAGETTLLYRLKLRLWLLTTDSSQYKNITSINTHFRTHNLMLTYYSIASKKTFAYQVLSRDYFHLSRASNWYLSRRVTNLHYRTCIYRRHNGYIALRNKPL